MECYIVLQPHSLTNPSNKYRVVYSEEWNAFANNQRTSIPFYASFDTPEEAEKCRDEMNTVLNKKDAPLPRIRRNWRD